MKHSVDIPKVLLRCIIKFPNNFSFPFFFLYFFGYNFLWCPRPIPPPPPLSLHPRQSSITLTLSAEKGGIKKEIILRIFRNPVRVSFSHTRHMYIAHMLLVPFVGALIGIKTFDLLPFTAENDALNTYFRRNVHSQKMILLTLILFVLPFLKVYI